MDDFSIGNLQESRNEYCSRLITILTPHIIEGLKSIFQESWKLCVENDEKAKYLMTFQNFLTRVPKWNPTIIKNECNRIKEKSNCAYIDDLITCVHIIQLKMLSCMRVGQKQKKVNIDVPSLDDFIHNVYINVARKVYTNVYLFEVNVKSLQVQRNTRELELIVRECILQTIRDNIPVENLLKLYMDETVEEATDVQEKEEIIGEEPVIDGREDIEEKESVERKEEKREDEKRQEEEKESLPINIEQIKAENASSNVSFNLMDNKVISIEADELSDLDIEEEEDEEDEDDEGFGKLKIGEEIKLTIDDMPSEDGVGEINIDAIPLLEEVSF